MIAEFDSYLLLVLLLATCIFNIFTEEQQKLTRCLHDTSLGLYPGELGIPKRKIKMFLFQRILFPG